MVSRYTTLFKIPYQQKDWKEIGGDLLDHVSLFRYTVFANDGLVDWENGTTSHQAHNSVLNVGATLAITLALPLWSTCVKSMSIALYMLSTTYHRHLQDYKALKTLSNSSSKDDVKALLQQEHIKHRLQEMAKTETPDKKHPILRHLREIEGLGLDTILEIDESGTRPPPPISHGDEHAEEVVVEHEETGDGTHSPPPISHGDDEVDEGEDVVVDGGSHQNDGETLAPLVDTSSSTTPSSTHPLSSIENADRPNGPLPIPYPVTPQGTPPRSQLPRTFKSPLRAGTPMNPRVQALRFQKGGNPSSAAASPRRRSYADPLSTPQRSRPILSQLTPTRFRTTALDLDVNARLQRATWEDLYGIFFTTDPTISRNGQIESKERFPNLFDILPKIANIDAIIALIGNYAILIPYTTPHRERSGMLLLLNFSNPEYEKDHMYLKFYALMQAMTLEQLQQFLPEIDAIIGALNRTQQEACFTKEALWIHCCRALEAAFVREVDFPQTILDFEKEKYERCAYDWENYDYREDFNFEGFYAKYGIVSEEDKARLQQKRAYELMVIGSNLDKAKLECALTAAATAIPNELYCCLEHSSLVAGEKLQVRIPAKALQQAARLRVERRPDLTTLSPQSQWNEHTRSLHRSYDDKHSFSWLLEIMRINGEDPSTILEGFFGDLSDDSEALFTLLQEFNRVFFLTKPDDETLKVFAQAQDHIPLGQLQRLPCFRKLLPHLRAPAFQTYTEQALEEDQALSEETSRFTFEVLVTHANPEQLQTVLKMCTSNRAKLQSIIRALNQHSYDAAQKAKLQAAMQFAMTAADQKVQPSEIVEELNYYELSTFLEIATDEQILDAFLSEVIPMWEHEHLESCAKDIAERATPEQFAYLVNNCNNFEHFCLLLAVGLQNNKIAAYPNIQVKLNEMGCWHIVSYFKETHQRSRVFNFILNQILENRTLLEAFFTQMSMAFTLDLAQFVIANTSAAAPIGQIVHNNVRINVRKQKFLQVLRDEAKKKKGLDHITQATLTIILQAFQLPEEGEIVATTTGTSPEPQPELIVAEQTPLQLPRSLKSPAPRTGPPPAPTPRANQRTGLSPVALLFSPSPTPTSSSSSAAPTPDGSDQSEVFQAHPKIRRSPVLPRKNAASAADDE